MLWRSKPGARFLYSYNSRNSSRFSPLQPGIAPETAVWRRRPLKTLLEHPPKRTTFYILLSRRKLCSHLLLWHYLWWDSRVDTKPPKSRPPNLGTRPSKPKTYLGRNIHDLELLRLGDVAMCTAAITHHVELLILKLYFQAKRPYSCLSFIDQPINLFFIVLEVSACF